jgi:hypothetical protein
MNDLIKQAVELAEGFEIDTHADERPDDPELYCTCGKGNYIICVEADNVPPLFLDALALQLVRQVDALPSMTFEIFQTWSRLTLLDAQAMPKEEFYGRDKGRTMNTIKAIVESGVLEQQEK